MTADPMEILRRRDAEIEKVRSYVDLTSEAKQRRIDETTEKANADYREAREAEAQRLEKRLRDSEKAVFSVVDDTMASASERAAIHSAYRAAVGEVRWVAMEESEGVGTQQALLDLLKRAERSGDTLMQKAVFHYGVDNALQPIVDQYLDSKPSENSKWERYAAAVAEHQQANDPINLLTRAYEESALVGDQGA
jgi:cystathionine beta-lyase/cystathionine gamma-synthase